MNETKNVIDIEEIFKERQISVSFINREMQHPYAQFADNMSISYADDP
jgi:hypothetical protein